MLDADKLKETPAADETVVVPEAVEVKSEAEAHGSGGLLNKLGGLLGKGKDLVEGILDTNDDGKVDGADLKAVADKVAGLVTPALDLIKAGKNQDDKAEDKKDKKKKDKKKKDADDGHKSEKGDKKDNKKDKKDKKHRDEHHAEKTDKKKKKKKAHA